VLVAAIVIGAGVIMEFLAMIQAPIGYQDETGFHIGAKRADAERDGLGLNPS
jgi:hypothetical protein